jgi:hypothetical protein
MTVEEIQKAEIAIDDVVEAIWKGLHDDFGGAAAEAQDTWAGLTASLISYWDEFERRVMSYGAFDSIKDKLRSLLEIIDRLEKEGTLDKWAQAISNSFVDLIEHAESFGAWVAAHDEEILNFFRFLKAELDVIAKLTGVITDGMPKALAKATTSTTGLETSSMNQAFENEIRKLEVLKKGNILSGIGIGKTDKEIDKEIAKIREAQKKWQSMQIETIKKIEKEHEESEKKKTLATIKSIEKRIVAEKKGLLKKEKDLSAFENAYMESQLNKYDYQLWLLAEEYDKYAEMGANKIKLDKWYKEESTKIFNEMTDQKIEEYDRMVEAINEKIPEIPKLSAVGIDDALNDFFDPIDQAEQEIRDLESQIDATSKQIKQSFSTGAVDALYDFIDGTKTAEQAFGDFAQSFLTQIAKMILQQTIFNAISSIGGAGGGMFFAAGGLITEPVVGRGQKTGQPYVFGERGTERVTPGGGAGTGGGAQPMVMNVIVKNEEEAARQIAEGQSRGAVVNVIWQELPEIMRNMNRMQ